MNPTLKIEFADAEDLMAFARYAELAKTTEGTVSGLRCGLMCSALKRAKVSHVFVEMVTTSPELLEALKALLAYATAISEPGSNVEKRMAKEAIAKAKAKTA